MRRTMGGNTIPVLIVLAVLLVIWYAAATLMNAPWQAILYERAGKTEAEHRAEHETH